MRPRDPRFDENSGSFDVDGFSWLEVKTPCCGPSAKLSNTHCFGNECLMAECQNAATMHFYKHALALGSGEC